MPFELDLRHGTYRWTDTSVDGFDGDERKDCGCGDVGLDADFDDWGDDDALDPAQSGLVSEA